MTKRRLPLLNLARYDGLRAARDRAAAAERATGAAPREWFKIVNAKDAGPSTVYIYDEIGFWGVTAADFATAMKDVTSDKITVRINSPGGECYDGLAIYNTLVSHDAEINVMIDGLAASAASFIAMAGDTIKIARHGEMMIHDASGLCWGNAAEMERMVEMLHRMSDNIADIYALRAGGEAGDWRALMRAETWYSGREAVSAKLADATFNDPGEKSTEDTTDAIKIKTFDLSVFRFAGRRDAYDPTDQVDSAWAGITATLFSNESDLSSVETDEDPLASLRKAI